MKSKILKICTDLGYWRLEALHLCACYPFPQPKKAGKILIQLALCTDSVRAMLGVILLSKQCEPIVANAPKQAGQYRYSYLCTETAPILLQHRLCSDLGANISQLLISCMLRVLVQLLLCSTTECTFLIRQTATN